MTFDELHSLPFDEYMQYCNNHAVVSGFKEMFDDMTMMEALWARRYWFVKNGAYNDS